jgi:uncharacterized hydrophobic protein (TIGR00271 family)
MKISFRRSLADVLAYRFNLDEDKANEEEIKESLKRNVEFRGTNLWALIFAIFIASIGLNVNSTAVIIGAMLISPLMGPIMGVGLGAGTFDFELIRFSIKNLFIAVVISLMTSAFYFWLSPINQAQSELLARTTPTIWDVLIALFGGLAGIIASSRKNISNTIPGVAIATALMPPLCTAGYGIGTGNIYYFLGAFYLFLINTVFISISTFLMVRFLKFKSAGTVDRPTERKVKKYIWTIAVLTILPSLFLAYRFVDQEIFKQHVHAFIRSEVEGNNLYVINQKIKPAKKEISFLVYGELAGDSLLSEILKKKGDYGLGDAHVTMKAAISHADISDAASASSPDLSKTLSERGLIIMEKDKKIKMMESRLKYYERQDSTFTYEFQALFGKVQELSLSETILYRGNGEKDSVLLVYVKSEKRIKNTNQVKTWLKARYKPRNVHLVLR